MWVRRLIGAALLLLAAAMFIPIPTRTVKIKVDLPPDVSPQQAQHGMAWFEAAMPVIALGIGAAFVLALVVGGLWLIVPTLRRGASPGRR